MKLLIAPVLLLTVLSGCAGTPGGEALVEDRSVKAEAKTTNTTPAAANLASIQESGARTPGNGSAGAAPSANRGAATSAKPDAKTQNPVQTQGINVPVTEVKSLDPGLASAKPAKDSATQHPLRDPKNLLSHRRLNYDYDSAAIREEYQAMLEAHAQYLKGNKSANLILQGHADERGSREYNLALGQRRAEGVLKALEILGVSQAQMEPVSLGEEKPLAEGQDENAWRQNRRVEFLYQGE